MLEIYSSLEVSPDRLEQIEGYIREKDLSTAFLVTYPQIRFSAIMASSVGRKVLIYDEIPDGAIPRYDVVTKDGDEEIYVQYTDLSQSPVLSKPLNARKLIKAVDDAATKIRDKEDKLVISSLIKAARSYEDNIVFDVKKWTTAGLNKAFRNIEESNLVATRLLMNPKTWGYIRKTWGSDFVDISSEQEAALTGVSGHLWTAAVIANEHVPQNKIIVLGERENTGALAIKSNGLRAEYTYSKKKPFLLKEEVGVALNEPFISMVEKV